MDSVPGVQKSLFVSQKVPVIIQINLYKFTKLSVIYIMILSTLNVNVSITSCRDHDVTNGPYQTKGRV